MVHPLSAMDANTDAAKMVLFITFSCLLNSNQWRNDEAF